MMLITHPTRISAEVIAEAYRKNTEFVVTLEVTRIRGSA